MTELKTFLSEVIHKVACRGRRWILSPALAAVALAIREQKASSIPAEPLVARSSPPSSKNVVPRAANGRSTVRKTCLKIVARVLKRDTALWVAAISVLISGSAVVQAAGRETLVKISTERSGEVTRFFIENLQAADVTVTFDADMQNLSSSVRLPVTRTLAARERAEVVNLQPHDVKRHWTWAYTYHATYGGLTAEHDNSVSYALPYAPGQSFRVSQGFHGKYSHFGPNEYAIDWKMPVGTPVHAAREGVVVAAKDDSDRGGPDASFDADANFVLVRHSDGTLGHYVHLMQGGNRVKVGDAVQVGDLLGHSGNTGHSTGPHLHFSVFKARSGKERETMPVRFDVGVSDSIVLEAGRQYKAPGVSTLLASPKAPARDGAAMGRP